MIERGTRNTILVVEKNLSKDLIRKKIQTHCEGSVKVFTDDYTIYMGLEEHPQVKEHQTINHSEKMYADGENHVNNCENRHSLLRPHLNIFRGVSKNNLNTYVKFFQFTFNKGINWFQKALKLILQSCTHTGRWALIKINNLTHIKKISVILGSASSDF